MTLERNKLSSSCRCSKSSSHFFFSSPMLLKHNVCWLYHLCPMHLNALEPVLSERLMRLHHGKHHQAYTDKANVALKAIAADQTFDAQVKDLVNQPIEVILTQLETLPEQYRLTLRNNGGGYVNHQLFFSMLRAPTATAAENKPSDALLQAIEQSFGSFEKFKEAFTTASLNLFGSGWVWLYADGASKKLLLISTANQDNPWVPGDRSIFPTYFSLESCSIKRASFFWASICGNTVCRQLFHAEFSSDFLLAYYLVYENRRNEYVESFWRLVNWSFVAQLYESGPAKRVDL